MSEWATRIKVLVISAVFASIANTITSYKADPANMITPLESVPGLLTMIAMIIVGCFLQEALEKTFKFHLPTILYISTISVIASIPGVSPVADFVVTEFNKVGLLPLCTPILAYAGISIGKDMETFKKQGFAIICVALCTFFGTYIGSAVIAQLVLKLTGVI